MNIKSLKLASFIILKTNKKYKKTNNEITFADMSIDEFEKYRALYQFSKERKLLNIYTYLKNKKRPVSL